MHTYAETLYFPWILKLTWSIRVGVSSLFHLMFGYKKKVMQLHCLLQCQLMTANAKLQTHAVFVFQKEEDRQEAKDWPITKGAHFEMLCHNSLRPASAKLEYFIFNYK